jgi:hypothetical protein
MRRRIGRPSLLGTAARTAVIAGTATAVSGNVAQKQAAQQQAQQQAAAQEAAARQARADELARLQAQVSELQASPPTPAPAAPGGGDLMAQLQQLASMHQAGILSDTEFTAAKAKLLG